MSAAWLDPALPVDERVRALVDDLSAADVTAVLLGDFTPLAQRGVPAPDYVDSGTGLRDVPGATAFPAGVALAATFDPALAQEYGAAVGSEARAAGFSVLLGPTLDLARDPRGGRIPEALGEDPWLSGLLGAAHVRGAQAQHVICQVKHFIAYNGDDRRTGYGLADRGDSVNVEIGDAVLHDTYLRPFQAAVEAGAWSLMSSYNRVNGRYPSEDADLLDLPRREWGWRGFYCPDFIFAVRDPDRALRAGLDLGALGGDGGRTADMVGAVDAGQRIAMVGHLVTALIGSGLVDHPVPARGPVDAPGHRDLAERVAVASSVLLTNVDGALPLGPDVTSVALIGPSGADALFVTGGSAAVSLGDLAITPADGVRATSGDRVIEVVQGSLGDAVLPAVPPEVLTLPDASGPGVRVEFTGEDGAITVGTLDQIDHASDPTAPLAAWPARWSTQLTPRRTGTHRLSLALGGRATVRIDGVVVMQGAREAERFIVGPPAPLQATVDLTAGQSVLVEITYEPGPSIVIPPMGLGPSLRLGWQEPDDLIDDAVAAAARCDAAVVLVTMASSEGMDRDTIALPGDQDELVRRVAAVNPRTVVVLNTPGAVLLPWASDVAAILQVWYPGERFGSALGTMLFGDAEPGGRLPLTFPHRRADLPGGDHGPETVPTSVAYDADGGIGYRAPGVQRHGAAFPFGHGLAYAATSATVLGATVVGGQVRVLLQVLNEGTRDTTHVAQGYVSVRGEAPELAGMARIRVAAGESATGELVVGPDAFARWDQTTRRPVDGVHGLVVGISSADPGVAFTVAVSDGTIRSISPVDPR